VRCRPFGVYLICRSICHSITPVRDKERWACSLKDYTIINRGVERAERLTPTDIRIICLAPEVVLQQPTLTPLNVAPLRVHSFAMCFSVGVRLLRKLHATVNNSIVFQTISPIFLLSQTGFHLIMLSFRLHILSFSYSELTFT